MFDSLFPKHWTTLQRLMWLKTNALARAVYETITGNPVSFTAKAAPLRQLEVAFSPVQDLHGYDSPWPAGGGVNKANLAGATIYETLPTWASASVDIDAEEITITGTPTGATSQFRLIRVPNIENGLGLKAFGSNLVNSLLWDGTYRTIQVVLTGMTAGTAVNIKFKFVAYEGQTAPAAWTPYSNECPISGWSSLTVEQRGKNLFDVAHNKKNLYVGGGSGRTTGNDGVLLCFSLKKGAKYTLRAPTGRDRNGLFYTDSPISDIVSGFTFDGGGGVAEVYTFEAEYNTYAYYANATWSDTIGNDFIVCLGEEAPAEYVPYNPLSRSISISLGSTVYSGYVDVLTGVVTVTHRLATIDQNSNIGKEAESWNPRTNVYYVNVGSTANLGKYTNVYHPFPGVSNILNGVTYNVLKNTETYWCVCFSVGGAFFEITSPLTTQEDLKTFLETQPITICYELATPFTIQLTPQEVQSLAGDNVLFSDANGDLTVTYRSN